MTMSEPFTLTGRNFQTLEKLEELRLAFSERYYACNGRFRKYVWQDNTYQWVDGDGTAADSLQSTRPTIANQPAGHNLQAIAFFRGIQDFINDGGAASDDWPRLIKFAIRDAEASPFFETIESFFQAVGGDLYRSADDFGLRRAVDLAQNGSPVIVRGLCQTGDILGPWLIDDLIACLSAITATRVFYDPTDDGTRLGIHNCGIYITCPAWYSRRSIYQYVHEYYRMVNSSTCTTTLSNDAYYQQLEAETLPAGEWYRHRTGHLVDMGGWGYWVYDEPAAYYWVDYNSATQTYGWPEPWETLVSQDLTTPPWEKVIPPGDWGRQSIGHMEWKTTEENGSGYPSVNVGDTVFRATNIYQRCSYKPNLSSQNAPALTKITCYKQVFTWVNMFDRIADGPAAKMGDYQLGDTLTLNPERSLSETDPYFVANWDFTTAGNPAA